MKTIEQAANEYIESLQLDDCNSVSSTQFECYARDDFKAGVEFAQRWIPIEEEKPPLTRDCVLVKWVNAKGIETIGLASYLEFSCNVKKPHLNFTIKGSCKQMITHWRLIELK